MRIEHDFSEAGMYTGPQARPARRFLLLLTIISVFVVVVISLSLIITYNGLVTSEQRVEEAKAQVEVVCQRKLNLIPNLVEIVKAYAEYEKETLTAVITARTQTQDILKAIATENSISSKQMERLAASESQLQRSLTSLFALVENYPSLKANTNFVTLQDQLEGTENRISVARQRYNYSVRIYNTKVAKFPGSLVARAFDFEQKNHFKAVEAVETDMKIEF